MKIKKDEENKFKWIELKENEIFLMEEEALMCANSRYLKAKNELSIELLDDLEDEVYNLI